MRFNVSSTVLCNRLQTLSRVLASKNSLQILDCILFELAGGTLRLTASDSETTLVTTLDVQEADADGRFAIKASTIINGLKEISEQPITIDVNGESHEILITYQNGRSSFVGQSGDEYPAVQPISEGAQQIGIAADVLLGGISRALFATAEDELRPVMNGIYFDITTDNLTFVASDGHKLVRNRCMAARGEQPAAFILPKKPAKTLKDILGRETGEAVIRFDERNAQITLENYTLNCRLIEGRYPNYASVIPSDNPFRVTIDRAALIGALRRVLVFASTSTSLVKLRIDTNNMTVSAQDIDFSTSAEEHILCDYSGTPMSIGFKGTFLIDILNSITSQEVVLELADPSRAGVIVPVEQEENEDLLMLLMPMMLNE
ncbi:MAG: DNA polymerase III subunit beta [Prevotellaceae bacterium]|nr:DNA polymerase III subunit beta [Prevotellaceae bacterium]